MAFTHGIIFEKLIFSLAAVYLESHLILHKESRLLQFFSHRQSACLQSHCKIQDIKIFQEYEFVCEDTMYKKSMSFSISKHL